MENQVTEKQEVVYFSIDKKRWFYNPIERGYVSQLDWNPTWDREDQLWVVRNKTMPSRIIAVQDISVEGQKLAVVRVTQSWGKQEVGQVLVVRTPSTKPGYDEPVFILVDGRSSIPASCCEILAENR